MLCVAPKMCGAPGGFSRPSRLLKHLFSSHISLRTRSSKLAPADALRVAGCSSRIVIEWFPSRPHPPPSCPPMLMLAPRPVSALRYQSAARRLRLAPAPSPPSRTMPLRFCPAATPQQRWLGGFSQTGRSRQTRGRVISV